MKICIVGCGGIGVELIYQMMLILPEQLVHITLIDMDFVEFSNLSRQYIFTEKDIGQAKTEACKRYIVSKVPDISVAQYNCDVKNEMVFNAGFFGEFDFVFNALDNIEARQSVARQMYVGKLVGCKSVLVDCGTAGLQGSVSFYFFDESFSKSEGVCCRQGQKEAPIPVCTLRTKPTSERHCIIFAKVLIDGFSGVGELADFAEIGDPGAAFEKIFGQELPESENSPLKTGAEDELFSVVQVWRARQLFRRYYAELRRELTPYDKNFRHHNLFLAAVAALRCHQFGIPVTLSPFEAAAVAGRIVPALGFSNAAVACIALRGLVNGDFRAHFVTKKFPYFIADSLEAGGCSYCRGNFWKVVGRPQGIQVVLGGSLIALHKEENDDDSDWFDKEEGDQQSQVKDAFEPQVGSIYECRVGLLIGNLYYAGAGEASVQMLQKASSEHLKTEDLADSEDELEIV